MHYGNVRGSSAHLRGALPFLLLLMATLIMIAALPMTAAAAAAATNVSGRTATTSTTVAVAQASAAAGIAASAGVPAGERTAKVLEYVFLHEAEDKNITKEEIQEILTRARPCLDTTMPGVDRQALDGVLGVLEQTRECLRVVEGAQISEDSAQQFLECFKALPDIPGESLDIVDVAVDACVQNPTLRLKEIVASAGDD